jgi:hypothetical protein
MCAVIIDIEYNTSSIESWDMDNYYIVGEEGDLFPGVGVEPCTN